MYKSIKISFLHNLPSYKVTFYNRNNMLHDWQPDGWYISLVWRFIELIQYGTFINVLQDGLLI